jgi:YD repeat-containing protein
VSRATHGESRISHNPRTLQDGPARNTTGRPLGSHDQQEISETSAYDPQSGSQSETRTMATVHTRSGLVNIKRHAANEQARAGKHVTLTVNRNPVDDIVLTWSGAAEPQEHLSVGPNPQRGRSSGRREADSNRRHRFASLDLRSCRRFRTDTDGQISDQDPPSRFCQQGGTRAPQPPPSATSRPAQD